MLRKEWLMVAVFLMVAGALGCARQYVKNSYPEMAYSERQTTGIQWKAGVAQRDITPQAGEEMYLAGYGRNRTSAGVHDPLSARCLVLSNGEMKIGIVSLDLLGMLGGDVMRIKQRVHALWPENLIVSFTHTHSAPDTTGLWGSGLASGRNERYIHAVIQAAADCVNEASSNTDDVELWFGTTQFQLSEFDNDTAKKPDSVLTVIHGIKPYGNRETLFTLVNYAVHPHIINNRSISADIAASFYMRVYQLGGGMGIFVNGAQGNVGPAIPHHKNDWNAIDVYGRTLAETALAAPRTKSLNHTIVVRRDVLKVKLENFYFKLAMWLGAVPDLRDEHKNVPLEIAYFRIGELAMVTVPGEAFPNIGKDMRERMQAPYEIVCGLCNGAYGYIMYRPDYDAYRYHKSMSLGPIGEILYQSFLKLIE